VTVWWVKKRWRCGESLCGKATFTEVARGMNLGVGSARILTSPCWKRCGRRSKTGRFRRSRSERFGQSIEPCSALMLGRVSMPRSRSL
jgi:hypothetical protein